MGSNSMSETSSRVRRASEGVVETQSSGIKIFLNEDFHGKKGIASSKIRGHNLVKHWPELSLYRFGDNPEVLIFQKIYITYNYRFPEHFQGIKILDICDPDWKDTPDVFIKETLDCMDAVVTSSKPLADFLQTMTKTRCLEIKDRFDMDDFPAPKKHYSSATKVAWFGYAHNAESLRFAMPSIESRNLDLIMISNEDPMAWRWATKPDSFQKRYKWIKYQDDMQAREALQEADLVIFPPGARPFDRFKSENKTVVAELCGLPVVRNSEELDKMMNPLERNKYIQSVHATLKKDYDVKRSVEEYKELIDEIRASRRQS